MTEYNVGDVVEVVELVTRGTITALDNHSPSVLCVDGVWYGSPFDIRVITPAPKRWRVGDVVKGGRDYQDESLPDGTIIEGEGSRLVKVGGQWLDCGDGQHQNPWLKRHVAFLPEA